MFKSFASVLAFAAFATSANAEMLSIPTADLDLSTATGAKRLDRRIEAAARKVCGSAEKNTGSRMRLKSSSECVKRTVAETRQRMAAGDTSTAG